MLICTPLKLFVILNKQKGKNIWKGMLSQIYGMSLRVIVWLWLRLIINIKVTGKFVPVLN